MKLKGKKISEVSQRFDLTGKELLPFAQDGENGSMSIDTIASYTYDKEGGDFTSRLAYDVQVPGVELIADRAEKDAFGNIITNTYITRSGAKKAMNEAIKEQLPDAIANINDGFVTPNMLSEETKQLFGAETITNFPDNEDIAVNASNQLTLADKEYNPTAYSGMGRKKLRKNMINGVNTLTQNMLNKQNTIYVIQYDFDLQGETLTIPEGCTLDFQGGSFSNGSVIGNNTKIKVELVKIFSLDINLSGNWNVTEAYPEWFGAKTNIYADQSEYIIKSFSLCNKVRLTGGGRFYYITNPIIVKSYQSLEGEGGRSDNSRIIKATNNTYNSTDVNYNVDAAIILLPLIDDTSGSEFSKHVSIKGIYIQSSENNEYGIYVYKGQQHLFDDVYTFGFKFGICTEYSWGCEFNRIFAVACYNGQVNPFSDSIGFSINKLAPSSAWTSMNFNLCYANNYHIGYYIGNVGYSTLTTCGCDQSINYSYYFYKALGITVNSCGCEFAKLENENDANYYCFYSSVVFNGCTSSSTGKHQSGINKNNKNILSVKTNSEISLNNCVFDNGSELENSLYYTISGYSYLHIINTSKICFDANRLNIDSTSAIHTFYRDNIYSYNKNNKAIPILPDTLYAYATKGGTANRPPYAPVAFQYFDTDLSKPIWKKIAANSTWVDANGTEV